MPLDAVALSQALDEPLTLHSTLCRREAAAFQKAVRNPDELVVACTQERRLFSELSAQTEGAVPLDVRPIRFVNIRETGGWAREAQAATPKIAALLAAAHLPDPDPVPTVAYQSQGQFAQVRQRCAHMLLGMRKLRHPGRHLLPQRQRRGILQMGAANFHDARKRLGLCRQRGAQSHQRG